MKDIKTDLMHKALLVWCGGEGIYTIFKVTEGIKSNGKRDRKGKHLFVTSWESLPDKHPPLWSLQHTRLRQ